MSLLGRIPRVPLQLGRPIQSLSISNKQGRCPHSSQVVHSTRVNQIIPSYGLTDHKNTHTHTVHTTSPLLQKLVTTMPQNQDVVRVSLPVSFSSLVHSNVIVGSEREMGDM